MPIQLLQHLGKNVMHGGKMRIVCPNCHAAYEVPESKLESILSLRCAACSHCWSVPPVVAPAKRQPAPAAPPAPAAAPANVPPEPPVAHVVPEKPQPQTQPQAKAKPAQTRNPGHAPKSEEPPTAPRSTVEELASRQQTRAVRSEPAEPAATPAQPRETSRRPVPVNPPAPPPEIHAAVPDTDLPDTGLKARSKKPAPTTGTNAINTALGIILLLLILLAASVLARHWIVKFLPASAKIFNGLGLS